MSELYLPAINVHLLFLVIIKSFWVGSSYVGNLDIQPHRYGFEVNLREKRAFANTKKYTLVLLPLRVRALFKLPTYKETKKKGYIDTHVFCLLTNMLRCVGFPNTFSMRKFVRH